MRLAWTAFAVAPAALVVVAFGCADDMSPASPAYSPDPLAEASAPPAHTGKGNPGDLTDAEVLDGYVCPMVVDAGYSQLYAQIFSTPGCGTTDPLSCHSTSGAMASGSMLDFTLDASAVYAELLGADGGGQVAANVGGFGPPVERVVPFEAGASLLYIKLKLIDASAVYGAGMPLTDPGSMCPEAVNAVRNWILTGAPQN